MFKVSLTLILVLSLMGLGCAKRQTVMPTQSVERHPITVLAEDNQSTDEEWVSISEVKTVHFDYDNAKLSNEDQKILQNNIEYFLNHPGIDVLVEGHCDQRGTTEYNLALGQKRADAVKRYYEYLSAYYHITSISYGKEILLDKNDSEEGWAKNRRVETKVRFNK